MTNTFSARRFARGFTLVETIIVLVVLAIAAAGIATMSGNIFNSEDANRKMQLGTKLVQECAEQILAIRRQYGYQAVVGTAETSLTPNCSNLTLPTGFKAPVIVVSAPPTGSTEACPTGATCRLLAISAQTTANEPTATINLLLVDYAES